jgi:hypothetical protein
MGIKIEKSGTGFEGDNRDTDARVERGNGIV